MRAPAVSSARAGTIIAATSRPPTSARPRRASARDLDRTLLADDGHLDLAGEGHLVGDLLGDLRRELHRPQIGHVLLDVDAHLASALHREGALDAAEAVADALE